MNSPGLNQAPFRESLNPGIIIGMRHIFTIFALAFLCACSHSVTVRGFRENAAPIRGLEGKKVAVVFVPGNVQDQHSTTSDVYTFNFQGITDAMEDAFKTGIHQPAELHFIREGQAPAGMDFYLLPSLTIRSVHDFWTLPCLVKMKLEVRNRSQKVVAESEKEEKSGAFMRGMDTHCKRAIAAAFNVVVPSAVGKAVMMPAN